MDRFIDMVSGNLSSSERIWSAAGPAIVVLAYVLGGVVVYLVRNLIRGPYRDEEMANRGSSVFLGMWLRQYFSWIMQPLWRALRFSGLPATAVTTLSVLLASAAAVAVGAGRFALGGWLYIFSGLCDFFDGRLARATGSAGPAGAALDSILDRYSDLVMLVGLGWYYRNSWVLLAVGAMMIGSAMIPYIRAKGESLGIEVKVGVMQRPERIVYLGLAVAFSPILEAIYVPAVTHPVHHLAVVGIVLLAVSTIVTAGQRMVFVLRALSSDAQPKPPWTGAKRGSLLRFTISSAIATGIDFLLVLLLVSSTGLRPWVATLLGCALGGAVNFAINRLWAFGVHGQPLAQISRYGFVSGSSALLNAGGVAVMMLLPTIDYRIAWAVARGAVFLFWNYPLNRNYVFLPKPSPADAPVEQPAASRLEEAPETRY